MEFLAENAGISYDSTEKYIPEKDETLNDEMRERLNINAETIAAINTWVETDDSELGEDENCAERLQALFMGISDPDKDGEITHEEQDVFDVITDSAASYLLSNGIDMSDIEALLSDYDNDAAERVKEYLTENMDMENMSMDSAFKKVVAFKDGKKTIKKKRVSGHFKMSGKQKAALKKAQRKSHGAGARVKRLKSMKARKKAGK